MSDITFSDVKIHNEIEFCKVRDKQIKKKLEKAFLENCISYYEKWDEPSFFSKILGQKNELGCTICVNLLQREKAEAVFDSLPEVKEHTELILKRVDKMFF